MEDAATRKFRHALPYTVAGHSPGLAALYRRGQHRKDDEEWCARCGSSSTSTRVQAKCRKMTCLQCGHVLQHTSTVAKDPDPVPEPPPTAILAPAPSVAAAASIQDSVKVTKARTKKKSALQGMLAAKRQQDESNKDSDASGGLAAFLSGLQ